MKKIGVIVGKFPSISETFIVNQITTLIDLGYDVQIFSYNRGKLDIVHKDVIDYYLLKKTTYALKPSNNIIVRVAVLFNFLIKNFLLLNWRIVFQLIINNFFRRELYSLSLLYRNSLFLIKTNVDCFIVHFGLNGIDIAYLKKLGFFKNKKLLVQFHGFDMSVSQININKKRYKLLIEYADHLVVNTEYLYDILMKVDDTIKNVSIIPVGLNFAKMDEYKLDVDKYKIFTVVYSGRLIKLKGGHLVLKVANELINILGLRINFYIIGDGELFDELMGDIIAMKLNDNVKMFGALTQEKLFDIYRRSHCFILPGINDTESNRAEAQGLVIQEAQYFRLPVIVSDAGGMKYGVEDGKTGFVVKQGDIKGFAKKIVKLYNDNELHLKMGDMGYQYVFKNYDNVELTKRILKLIS